MAYTTVEFGKLGEGQSFRFTLLDETRYIRGREMANRPGYGLFTDTHGRIRPCLLSLRVYTVA